VLSASDALSQQSGFLIRQQISMPLILELEFADPAARVNFSQAQTHGQTENALQ
jgi:hypothetical protein